MSDRSPERGRAAVVGARSSLAAAGLLWGLGACAGGGPPPAEPAGPSAAREGPTAVPDPVVRPWLDLGLRELHAGVRLEGLESRIFTQAELQEALAPILRGSSRLRVEEVGRSAEERPIELISFGSGPASVLLWSQMHGDESTATMALADIYALVERRPHDPVVETLLRELTVHTIPMLNPDGAQVFRRRNAQGVDVNRDARALATPEGRTLKAVHDRVRPVFGFNLHDQNVGTRVGDTDRGVAIALLSPPFDESRAVNDVRERAMRTAGVILRALEPMVGGHVARYDDTFNPRAFGDLMTRWGTSTILVESGGWEGDPEKQYLREVNFVAIVSALHAIATERWREVPTEVYASLPRNGRRVGDLLVRGGVVAVPGLAPLEADLLVNYENGAARTGGTLADVGDLADYEARDTVAIEGLYVIPREEMLDRSHGGVRLVPGAPARFVAARDSEGREVVWRFEGAPPEGW